MAFKGDAFDENVVKRTFLTNHYGTAHCIQTFRPLLTKNGGKIINVSSMASVSALRKMSEANRTRAFATKTLDEVTELLEDFRKSVAKGTYKEDGWPESAYGMSKVSCEKSGVQACESIAQAGKVAALVSLGLTSSLLLPSFSRWNCRLVYLL